MGLLDTLFGAPGSDQSQAMGLLAAGMMQGNMGGGLLAANNIFSPDSKLARALKQAQVDNYASEAAQRAAQTAAAKQEAERLAGIQRALPGLMQQPGMTGGEPVPQTMGGMPMFSQPMAASPMRQQPGGFDVRRAMTELGMKPKEVEEYVKALNSIRPEVARTIKSIGADGRENETQYDKFGNKVGDELPQYRAPISVNRGNSNDFLDPYTLQPKASFKTFQDPNSAASNAVTMRGQDMTDTRARQTAELGTIPAGYRRTPDGKLEFIPGGPADPNAAKRAASTEFQGKSATFGARAQEADKILNRVGTDYSPAGVNAKIGVESVPLVGQGLGFAANSALSDNSQKAEQAQRNFMNAVLRQESGAAISASEFDNGRKQYFPQPGDSAAVIAQKADNRRLAINGFRENARPGAVDEVANGGATPKATLRFNPATGQLEPVR